MSDVGKTLEDRGVAQFIESFDGVLEKLDAKRVELSVTSRSNPFPRTASI